MGYSWEVILWQIFLKMCRPMEIIIEGVERIKERRRQQ